MIPQLFESGKLSDIEMYIQDPNWCLEQKVDGMRCMVVIDRDGIQFLTRGGKELKSSAAKLHFSWMREAFEDLAQYRARLDEKWASSAGPAEIVLDGEIVTETGQLAILDLPFSTLPGRQVRPELEFVARRVELTKLFTDGLITDERVRPVAHAASATSKAFLHSNVLERGLEGLMAKHKDSEYTDTGKRVKHSVKLKFTRTADVVILDKNAGESKNSIRGGDKINYVFGVYDFSKGDYVKLGNCSGIGKEDALLGDIIEVKYLYRGAGGKLVQPTMLRRRPDKKWFECRLDQFIEYSKVVL